MFAYKKNLKNFHSYFTDLLQSKCFYYRKVLLIEKRVQLTAYNKQSLQGEFESCKKVIRSVH